MKKIVTQLEGNGQVSQLEKNNLIQPSELSLKIILDFAQAYQVKKTSNNEKVEFVLN